MPAPGGAFICAAIASDWPGCTSWVSGLRMPSQVMTVPAGVVTWYARFTAELRSHGIDPVLVSVMPTTVVPPAGAVTVGTAGVYIAPYGITANATVRAGVCMPWPENHATPSC